MNKIFDDNQQLRQRWAFLSLPGRIDSSRAEKLLGFAEHDLPVLIAAGLLKPLGKPSPNAPKYFASVEILGLAMNGKWLDKCTRRISEHWRERNKTRSFAKPKATEQQSAS